MSILKSETGGMWRGGIEKSGRRQRVYPNGSMSISIVSNSWASVNDSKSRKDGLKEEMPHDKGN
jgi:hypothetical protein